MRIEYLPTRATPTRQRNPGCMDENVETWDAMSKKLPEPYATARPTRAGKAGNEPIAEYMDVGAPDRVVRVAETEPETLQVSFDAGAPLLW